MTILISFVTGLVRLCTIQNLDKSNYYQSFLFLSTHSWIWYFIKTILLDDILTFGGKSPFLTKRLIVDTDSPINFETSFIVKKGLFSELVMVVKWSWKISFSSISYIRLFQGLSGEIYPTFARGVYKFQKLSKVTL